MKTSIQNLPSAIAPSGDWNPSQPSLRFPFRPISPPRVDNSNQPWYGSNTRWFLKGPAEFQDYNPILQESRVGADGKNMSDVWLKFHSFFGGADAKSNLVDQSGVKK